MPKIKIPYGNDVTQFIIVLHYIYAAYKEICTFFQYKKSFFLLLIIIENPDRFVKTILQTGYKKNSM